LKAQARRKAEEFVPDPRSLGAIFRLAIAFIQKRSLDEETAKNVFSGEVKVDVSDQFCEALRLLHWAISLERDSDLPEPLAVDVGITVAKLNSRIGDNTVRTLFVHCSCDQLTFFVQ
jgi:hypothetical protein